MHNGPDHNTCPGDHAPDPVSPYRILTDPALWLALAAAIPALAIMSLWMPINWGFPGRALIIWGVIVFPVLEELVFRGLIQGWLLKRMHWALGPLSGANLLTSALFAAAHLLHQSPLIAASILLPSLVFGWLRERHGRLAGCMLVHAGYNAAFLWVLV